MLIIVYRDLSADITGICDFRDLEFVKWSAWWKNPGYKKSEDAYDQFSFHFFITEPLFLIGT